MTVPDWTTNLPDSLEAPYQDFVMYSDGHGPYFHAHNLELMLAWAKRHKVKCLVLGGDTFDHDWISKWPAAYGAGNKPEVDAQINHCYDVLAMMAATFTKIYMVPGNHDIRPLRALEMRMGFDHWTRLFFTAKDPSIANAFTVAPSPRITLTGSPTGDWFVCHQRDYSRIAGRVASRIAAKYESNTITTHEHVGACGQSDGSGRWQAIAAPCGCDPRKIEYKHMQVTLHPNWTPGWVSVQGGVGLVHKYELERMRGAA